MVIVRDLSRCAVLIVDLIRLCLQGKAERDSVFVPLIAALNEHYKDVPEEDRSVPSA